MLVRFATPADISLISKLAYNIWPAAYQSILPAEQIDFMLNDMYSVKSLEKQFNENITFLIAEILKKPVAFASYSPSHGQYLIFKIHKLYISPEEQGKGIGKHLINFIKKDAISRGGKVLELNVNRNNPATQFYKKAGFEIFKEVNLPYHQFILNDYIMRMPL